jgi:membrane protease YdiL (CAAX protease family)
VTEEPQIPQTPVPEPEWGVLDLLLFFFAGIPFFLAGAAVIYGSLAAAGVQPNELRMLLAQFGGYVALLIPLRLIVVRKFRTTPMRLFQMAVPAGQTGVSLTAGVAASFAVLALAAALRMPKIETPMEKLLDIPAILAAAAVLGVTVGPWFEELIFRGLLQPVLVRFVGAVPGIVLAALPFSMLHGPQYGWSWRHMLLLTLAGASFGWLRHRTGSTGAAVLMHAGYNLVLFVGFIAAKWAGVDLQTT